MERAIECARVAAAANEVPVGAAILVGGKIVAVAHNQTVEMKDPTRHAEVLVIERALGVLNTDRLLDATLCVTLEPCAQCAGAIVLARVGKVLFGAYDKKAGMAGSVEDLLRHPALNHRPEVRGGVMEPECAMLLELFFGRLRRSQP